jgi:multisubunit Na+/H+ antiporter MnhE subunit
MIAGGNISWLYIGFGILSAGLVSIASFRLKLVEKDSELLYMSFGFYRHFFKIFFKNFFSSLKLIFRLAFDREPIHPTVHIVKLEEKNNINPALLMTSLSMSTGLFCIGVKDEKIMVHVIDEKYFKKFDAKKISADLKNINDDNLV